MSNPGVGQEIQAGEWVSDEEFVRGHVPLHAIAGRASHYEIAWNVGSAQCDGVNVIERSDLDAEERAAVHAAASTITHGRALDGSLIAAAHGVPWPAREAAWRSGKGDSVKALA